MAKKFNVTCTLIYNGNVEIEADTIEEALTKAEKNFEFPEDLYTSMSP